jgi:hypothetical protein
MTPWAGDQPVVRPLPTQDNTNTEYTHTDIYASSGIRNDGPSVRAGEGGSRLNRAATVIGQKNNLDRIIIKPDDGRVRSKHIVNK